jgi:hypothetical protein
MRKYSKMKTTTHMAQRITVTGAARNFSRIDGTAQKRPTGNAGGKPLAALLPAGAR